MDWLEGWDSSAVELARTEAEEAVIFTRAGGWSKIKLTSPPTSLFIETLL
jgi:hypothetical protein